MEGMQWLSTTMTRRAAFKATGAATAIAALAGCGRGLGSGSKDSSTLQMTFWGEGDQNKKLIAAIDLFQKKNSGTKVATQYSGLNGYYDKLATRLAGGNPPDIFQIHLPFLLDYVRRDAVLNLDDYAADLGLPDVPPYIATTSKLDDHWYFALVGAATQPAIIYDKSKVDQLGLDVAKSTWTLADYQAAMAQVTSAAKGQLHGSADFGGNVVPLESYMRGQNKPLFDGSGKLAFSQGDFATWLRLWDTLRKNSACVPMTITATAVGFDTDPVVTGKSAYTLTATSRGFPSIQTLTKDTLGILPFPRASAASASGTNIIPADWFAISKKSNKVDKAVALLKFLASDEEAATTMQLARGVPIAAKLQAAIKPTLQGIDKEVFDNYQQIAAQELSPLQPYPPGAGELMSTSLTNANQTVGFAKASIDAATNQFFTDATRLLK